VNKGEGALLGRYADVLCFARFSSFYSPRNAVYVRLCARSSAGESNGFLIEAALMESAPRTTSICYG